MTVTLQVAERLESSIVVAVIIASPTAMAVTKPLASIVATDSLDDDHLTDLSVANSGSTVATSVAVSVTSRMISVLSSDFQFRGGWDPTKDRGPMPSISVEDASGVIF